MIQRMLAIWSLVPLPFLNPAWTSGSSQCMYCWSLAWRILSITLLACEMGPFEGGFHYLHIPSPQFGLRSNNREGAATKIWLKIGLKIYWAWPRPSEQDLSQSLPSRLCGRGRGWEDLGEWHWNMYNIMYETSHQSRFDAWYWMLGAGALGRPRGMVWGGRREEGSGWGTHVYLWRIHFDIWQN